MSQRTVIGSSIPAIRLVFIMWLVFFIELYLNVNLGFLGIKPRTLTGTIGILTAPMIHGSVIHLVSNTMPVLFLGGVLFYFYHHIASKVFLQCYLYTNILVWLFGRPNYHIGASGLVFSMAAFLITLGLLKRDVRSLIISMVVIMLYGGIFHGVLPTDPQVSWESHLYGALVGIVTAYLFRKAKY